MPAITRMFHEVFQILWSENDYYYDSYPFLVQWLVDAWVGGPSLWIQMFWTPFTPVVSTGHLRLDHSRWMLILDVNWPKPLVWCSQPVIRHLKASVGQFYHHVVLVIWTTEPHMHTQSIWKIFDSSVCLTNVWPCIWLGQLPLQSSCWLR